MNATQYRRDVWVRIALNLAFLSAFYFSNQGVDQGNDNIGLSPALNCLKRETVGVFANCDGASRNS